MKVESFRDLLDWTSGYHQQLANCFSSCAGQQPNQRAQMLLNYLADQEMDLASRVRGFEDVAEDNALSTWCTEYLDQHPLMADASCDEAFASMDTNHIISKVDEQHQTIISLFQRLYERSQPRKLQELIAKVRDMEKQHAQQMTQGANRLEDI